MRVQKCLFKVVEVFYGTLARYGNLDQVHNISNISVNWVWCDQELGGQTKSQVLQRWYLHSRGTNEDME